MKLPPLLLTNIILLIILSCGDVRKPKKELKLPNNSDYNFVILEILRQDTTFINVGGLKSDYVGEDLIKLHIDLTSPKQDTFDNPPKPKSSQFQTSIADLISLDFTNSIQFKDDSLYFEFQNDSSFQIKTDKKILNSVKIATKALISENIKSRTVAYFQFSLPIFNSSLTKAYVQVDFISSSTYASRGMTYILEKINNKWILTLSTSRWVT